MNLLRNTIAIASISIIAIICMQAPLYAEDDGISIGIQEGDINVTTTPENPQPYENVTITLSSYATDINKAFIEWRNGSNVLLSGYGKTTYSLKAPGQDSTTTFDIVIAIEETGDRITKRITISSSEVELLWEAIDSYVPPFYRGKAYASPESRIRAVAIPITTTIRQGKGNVSYTWKSENSVIEKASGYNKNSYVFKNQILNADENITVTTSSVDGRYNATNTTQVPIVSPSIIFYKKSPTEGILFNQALQTNTIFSGDEMTVVAAPFYVALQGNEGSFNYGWSINGNEIETPPKRLELTIRPTSRGGYATINLIMENISSLFQKASGQLRINL